MAIILGAANVASATPRSEPTLTAPESAAVVAPYTDADVVEFLVFGSGPIVARNPEQITKLGLKSQDVPHDVVASATDQILSADPDFHTHVTRALLSGHPYQVREGLKSFSKTLSDVAKVQVPGDVSTNCVVWGIVNVFIAIEVAVAGAIVLVVAYRGDDSTSRFSQDEIAATLTTLN